MKKIKSKKLDFKKTNVVELNSEEARKIVGGSEGRLPIHTDPRSMFSMFCPFNDLQLGN